MKIKRFNQLNEGTTSMEAKVIEFKEYWNNNYGFIALELNDKEIADFIERSNNNIQRATDQAADYLLANGLADVMESQQINEGKELDFFEAFNIYIKGQTIDDYVSYPAYGTSISTDVAKRYYGEGIVCANGYKMISYGGGCSGDDCNTTFIIDDKGVLVARNEW